MSYLAIKKMLRDITGLNPEAVGHSTIDGVIRRKLRQMNIKDARDYEAMLRLDGDAFQDLIESVVVPETWFFRDKKPFEALVEFAAKEWHRKKVGAALRILSVPCAGGEEPYSIAMALKTSGMPASGFHIDAMDISSRAIERAMAGIYTGNSFRGNSGMYERLYFRNAGDEFIMDEAIKSLVSFRVGNLLDDRTFLGVETYDVIFCRNLIIYFDRSAQEKAARKLHGMLKNDGLLITGHAEGGGVINKYFTSRKKSGSFSYARNTGIDNKAAYHGALSVLSSLQMPLKVDRPDQGMPVNVDKKVEDAVNNRERQPVVAGNEETGDAHGNGVIDKSPEIDDCWRRIGVWGDKRSRCPRLDELIHCRNCDVYSNAGRKLLARPAGEQYAKDLAQRFAEVKQNPAHDVLSVVVFRLEDEWFGLPTSLFEEIVGVRKVHKLPHGSGDVLEGVVNIRGELYVCISMARLLGVAGAHREQDAVGGRVYSRMAIISKDGKKYAFQVSEVKGVQRFHGADIVHTPEAPDSGSTSYMIGMFSVNDRRVGYINVEQLFPAMERNMA